MAYRTQYHTHLLGTRQLRQFEIRGVSLLAHDEEGSLTLDRVYEELACDLYGLEDIPFETGDVVIDIGAHAGLVSVYLAMRWPFLRIHAFEPHPLNHENCAHNLRLNNVSNVDLYRRAVNGDGRPMTLQWLGSNTGGATAAFALAGAAATATVEATTLDRILDDVLAPGARCRLLKMDCEGMEYESLEGATQLNRIDYLAAEFHEPPWDAPELFIRGLAQPRRLADHCARIFSEERMRISYCVKQD